MPAGTRSLKGYFFNFRKYHLWYFPTIPHIRWINLNSFPWYNGNVTQKFRTIIKDDTKRRVVIDKDAWDKEGIQKGDLVEVAVKKLKVIE